MNYDYSQYTGEAPAKDDILAKISQHVDELKLVETEIAQLEIDLKSKKARQAELQEELIPELMEEVGLEEVRTRSGVKIRVTDDFTMHVSKDRKEAAYTWLDEHGHAALLKRTVVVAFNKGQEEEVRRLKHEILEEGFENVREDMEVHPQTLKAYLKGLLAEGQNVPVDLFGLRSFRTTKFVK